MGAVPRHRRKLLSQPRRTRRAPPVRLRHRGAAHRGRRQGRALALEHRTSSRRHDPRAATRSARSCRTMDSGSPTTDRRVVTVGHVGRRRGSLSLSRRAAARGRPVRAGALRCDHTRPLPGHRRRARRSSGRIPTARRRRARRRRALGARTARPCRTGRRHLGVLPDADADRTTGRALRDTASSADRSRSAHERRSPGRRRAARRRHLPRPGHRSCGSDRAGPRCRPNDHRRQRPDRRGVGAQRSARTPPRGRRAGASGLVPVPGGRGPRPLRDPARLPCRRTRDRACRRRRDPGHCGDRALSPRAPIVSRCHAASSGGCAGTSACT